MRDLLNAGRRFIRELFQQPKRTFDGGWKISGRGLPFADPGIGECTAKLSHLRSEDISRRIAKRRCIESYLRLRAAELGNIVIQPDKVTDGRADSPEIRFVDRNFNSSECPPAISNERAIA